MPPELPGRPPLTPVCLQRPLRRLTSIEDGTAPGGSNSLANPTMAQRPISRRSVAFPASLVVLGVAGVPIDGDSELGARWARVREVTASWRVWEHS